MLLKSFNDYYFLHHYVHILLVQYLRMFLSCLRARCYVAFIKKVFDIELLDVIATLINIIQYIRTA